MISRNNIKCFDYIYERSFNDNNSLAELESKFFDNTVVNYISFVKDNKELLEDPELLITKEENLIYNNFPKLNSYGIKEYFDYKMKEFIKIVENNLNYNFNDISSDLNISNQKALIKLIDYFIDQNIIECSGTYYTKGIIGFYDFNFSELKINSKIYSKNEDPIFVQNIEHQVNINGNNNKISKNDFSHKKNEIEKEGILDKFLKFIQKNIFKIKK